MYVSSDVTNRGEAVKPARQQHGIDPIIFWLSLGAVLALGFVAGMYRVQLFAGLASALNMPSSSKTLNTDLLQQTYRQLDANFDGELDEEALINGSVRGMVEAVGDDYTTFMNAEEAERMNSDLEGSIGGGIGAQVGIRDEVITLVKILEGTPAEKSDLRAGDEVLTINGKSTKGFTTEQAVEQIRGEVGTTVKLGLVRDGESLEKTITREEISVDSVSSEIKDGIGVMTITRFDQDTGRLARAAAESFKEAGVKGVILDMRGNPGGYLTAAQDVSSIWLSNKLVVVEKTGETVVDTLRSRRSAVLDGVPTVVLVDGNSASASEIVAGALHDHKAATLVGETTYGKGTVQRLITLTDGAILKVTVARWYTPNGLNLSKVGIKPDHVVKLSEEDIRNNNDTQMQKAEQLLRQ
ncbi:MAG TPA: S41 family peptidase [Candidatus Saccharibacteria bacterium]|nr:S41 family peptidase [Candidatus Saccharibacteria bacterium]